MTTLSKQRRKTPRFKVTIPVQINNGTGITHDFSTIGVFFETDQLVNIGDDIEFALVIEEEGNNPAQPRLERFGAKVVRVDELKGKRGVAAILKSIRIEDVDGNNKTHKSAHTGRSSINT